MDGGGFCPRRYVVLWEKNRVTWGANSGGMAEEWGECWELSSFQKPASVAFLGSSLLAAMSSLRLIWGWWQGAAARPGDLEGVMMGGQWPRAPGGRFVGGDSLLLVSRPRMSTSPTRAHILRQMQLPLLCLPLGEKWEGRSKQRGVFAQAHKTPNPSPPTPPPRPLLAERTQSFLPLLPLSRLFPPSPRVYWSSLGSAQI